MSFTYIHINMGYGAPTWQLWLSKLNISRTESLQNCAFCITLSKLVSTRIEASWMETNVPSYTTTSNGNMLRAKEKLLRLLTRSSCQRKANELSEALPDTLNHCQQMDLFNISPWYLNGLNSCNVYCSIPGISIRMSIKPINNHHADYVLYKDSSVTLGQLWHFFKFDQPRFWLQHNNYRPYQETRESLHMFVWRIISRLFNSFKLDKRSPIIGKTVIILLETFVSNLLFLTGPSLQILGKTQTGSFPISGFLVNAL